MNQIIRYRFRDSDELIAGQVYLGSGSETRGYMIFCQGMPYVPCMEAIVPKAIKSGLAVIQVHYAGTYDSDGSFTPQEAIQSIIRFALQLTDGKDLLDIRSLNPIKFGRSLSVIAGHSFGSWIAYQCCIQSSVFDYCLMFAPYFGFTERHGVVGAESLITHLDYVRRAVPLTHRFGDAPAWDNLYLGKESDSVNKAQCPVIPMLGSLDTGLDVKHIQAWIRERADVGIRAISLIDGVGHGLEGFASDDHVSEILRGVAESGNKG